VQISANCKCFCPPPPENLKGKLEYGTSIIPFLFVGGGLPF